jgi:hypothetical protein
LIGEQRGNPLLRRCEAIMSLPTIGVGLVETMPKVLDCPMRVIALPLAFLAKQFQFAAHDGRVTVSFRCLVMSILDSFGQCPKCPQVDLPVGAF